MVKRGKEGDNQYKAFCPIQLNQFAAHAYIDSGNNAANAMSWEFAQELGLTKEDLVPDPQFPEVNTADKSYSMRVMGRPKKKLQLRFGHLATKYPVRPLVIDGLSMAFNMCGPFLRKHGINQMHADDALMIQKKLVKLTQARTPQQRRTLAQFEPVQTNVYVRQATTVPVGSAAFLPLRVPAVVGGQLRAGDGLLEAHAHFVAHTDLHPALAVLGHVNEHGETVASVLNTSDREITVPEGLRFGSFSRHAVGALEPTAAATATSTPRRNDSWYIEQFQLRQSPFLQNPADLAAAVKLLKKYEALFSVNDDYGHTDLVEHAIITHEDHPIKCRNRPLNPSLEPQLREQLKHWQEQDVVEPSSSPWSFPLLAVPKKNGKIRFCVDYRGLNKVTVKDSFPLPSIEDNLARLAHSRIYSALDGTGAYHVVPVREEDREKTAFSTPWGLYQFKKMAFGLCNAPATYSRLVQRVLEGIPLSVAIPYLDDTAVHSRTLPDHLHGLDLVLGAHARAGLTLQPSKCQLFQDKIEYLGHEISEQGIKIPSKYVQVVSEWPVPTSVKDVRVFLGKVSYYRKFIEGFSHISAPLSDLTKDPKEGEEPPPFEMTPAAVAAFKDLKSRLQSAPILAYPQFDSEEPFILDTDWSGDPGAIGGVLSQVQDGEERVIAYGAKKLNSAEKSYSSHKGELLAAIYFIRYWKYYLQYRPFRLRTDHEALKWIRGLEEPKGMILRWLEVLANHEFEVEFRPGKRHGNADSLSRTEHPALLDTTDVLDHEMTDAKLAPIHMVGDEVRDGGRAQLLQHQGQDPVLQEVSGWVSSGVWPSKHELRAKSQVTKAYASLRGQLQLAEDGLLERVDPLGLHVNTRRPCIPATLQTPLLLQLHQDGGHRGGNNTYSQFIRRYYFPGAAVEAALVVKMCHTCQRNQPKPHEQMHTLASSPVGDCFQKWSIDFVGPLPTSSAGHTYILTAKDCFTRWVEAYPTENMTATTVARTLEKELFSRFGLPEQIHADRGTQFTSTLLHAVFQELGINGTHTPSYNPKSSPVERTHRDLGRMLRSCMEEQAQDWEHYLPGCLLALRTTVCRSTGFSPFFMVYGREAALPVDLLYGQPYGRPLSNVDYVNKLRSRLQQVFDAAREQQQQSINRSRQLYSGSPPGGGFKPGDLVWLFTPKAASRSRKLTTHWTGPWEVTEVLSPVLFKVKSGAWNDSQVEVTAAVDRLRPFHGRGELPEDQLQLRSQDVALADEFLELQDDDGDDGLEGPPLPGPLLPPHVPPPAPPPPPGGGGPADEGYGGGGGGGGGGGYLGGPGAPPPPPPPQPLPPPDGPGAEQEEAAMDIPDQHEEAMEDEAMLPPPVVPPEPEDEVEEEVFEPAAGNVLPPPAAAASNVLPLPEPAAGNVLPQPDAAARNVLPLVPAAAGNVLPQPEEVAGNVLLQEGEVPPPPDVHEPDGAIALDPTLSPRSGDISGSTTAQQKVTLAESASLISPDKGSSIPPSQSHTIDKKSETQTPRKSSSSQTSSGSFHGFEDLNTQQQQALREEQQQQRKFGKVIEDRYQFYDAACRSLRTVTEAQDVLRAMERIDREKEERRTKKKEEERERKERLAAKKNDPDWLPDTKKGKKTYRQTQSGAATAGGTHDLSRQNPVVIRPASLSPPPMYADPEAKKSIKSHARSSSSSVSSTTTTTPPLFTEPLAPPPWPPAPTDTLAVQPLPPPSRTRHRTGRPSSPRPRKAPPTQPFLPAASLDASDILVIPELDETMASAAEPASPRPPEPPWPPSPRTGDRRRAPSISSTASSTKPPPRRQPRHLGKGLEKQ